MTINLTAVVTGLLTFLGTAVVAWLGLRGKQGDQAVNTQAKFYTDLVERVNGLEGELKLRDEKINKFVEALAAERARTNMLAHLLRSSGIDVPPELLLDTQRLEELSDPTDEEAS